jgi:hypothetical protein
LNFKPYFLWLLAIKWISTIEKTGGAGDLNLSQKVKEKGTNFV